MDMIKNVIHSDSVRLREDGRAVVILDQSLLPGRTVYIELESIKEMYDAIFHLKVRGAPAIGICAAYCMAVLSVRTAENMEMSRGSGITAPMFMEIMQKHAEYLKSSRPTAVNLAWAADRVMEAAKRTYDAMSSESCDGEIIRRITEAVRREAENIHNEDIMMCRAISEYGLSLIKDGDGILTH